MKTTRKRICFLIVALFACVAVLSACGSTETPSANSDPAGTLGVADPQDVITAYFICPISGGNSWGAAEQGFLAACEELGWEGQYLTPADPSDMQQFVNLLETCITNKADVTLNVFGDASLVSDVLQRAKAQNIVTVNINAPLGEDLVDTWIGTDPEGMGDAPAKIVLDEAEQRGYDNITSRHFR